MLRVWAFHAAYPSVKFVWKSRGRMCPCRNHYFRFSLPKLMNLWSVLLAQKTITKIWCESDFANTSFSLLFYSQHGGFRLGKSVVSRFLFFQNILLRIDEPTSSHASFNPKQNRLYICGLCKVIYCTVLRRFSFSGHSNQSQTVSSGPSCTRLISVKLWMITCATHGLLLQVRVSVVA